MQYYANVMSFPLNIGGKPYNSWPAFIPITFEVDDSLRGAWRRVWNAGDEWVADAVSSGFQRAAVCPGHARDDFFLCIKARDRKFDLAATRRFLEELKPLAFMKLKSIIAARMSSLAARGARSAVHRSAVPSCRRLPPGYARAAKIFAGRAQHFFRRRPSERQPVAGTVARGQLRTGRTALHRKSEWRGGGSCSRFAITRSGPERGRERYNIYCSPCHDYTGGGHGMIVQRGFPAPPSFHIDRLRQAPAGHFFDVMTNGFGAMYSYASRVAPEDRWRIAAYIRALQLSQHGQPADVPEPQGQPWGNR